MESDSGPSSEDEPNRTVLLNEMTQCNPTLPVGMENDASKLKGDAIGNTLYSECWVIKILMKLTKFCPDDWNEDFETELCLLWDMTVEPDVVNFLMQHNFLELISRLLNQTSEPRLTEILVGIVGNMTCIQSVRVVVGRNIHIIRILLQLLSIPDIPTLLQLIRLLQTCFWDLRNIETTDVTDTSPKQLSNIKTAVQSRTPNVKTSISELDKERLEEKETASGSESTDFKQTEVTNNTCEKIFKTSVEKEQISPQSSVLDTEKSRLNSFALHEDSVKDLNTSESSIVIHKLNETDNQNENIKDRTSDQQLDLKEISAEKSAVGNMWLEELSGVKTWLPSIIFILNSCMNTELICCTLGLLDTLWYMPLNNDVLGKDFISTEFLEGLINGLGQMQCVCNEDKDLCFHEDFEKGTVHWAALMSVFASVEEGRDLLDDHAEVVSGKLISHMKIIRLREDLGERNAHFITMAVTLMGIILEDTGYFHPHVFFCLLPYVELQSKSKHKRKGKDDEVGSGFVTEETQQEMFETLKKYLVEVIQQADGETVASALGDCSNEEVAILRSVVGGETLPYKVYKV